MSGLRSGFHPCFDHASNRRRDDFPIAEPSPLNTRPEAGLLAMVSFQVRDIGVVRLDCFEVLDPYGKIGNDHQVLGGLITDG
jgi:hypothetical protein